MPFSILEWIDVGETNERNRFTDHRANLSVSSNGSTWVKPDGAATDDFWSLTFSILERIDVGETSRSRQLGASVGIFQYPRTDRRG